MLPPAGRIAKGKNILHFPSQFVIAVDIDISQCYTIYIEVRYIVVLKKETEWITTLKKYTCQ